MLAYDDFTWEIYEDLPAGTLEVKARLKDRGGPGVTIRGALLIQSWRPPKSVFVKDLFSLINTIVDSSQKYDPEFSGPMR